MKLFSLSSHQLRISEKKKDLIENDQPCYQFTHPPFLLLPLTYKTKPLLFLTGSYYKLMYRWLFGFENTFL